MTNEQSMQEAREELANKIAGLYDLQDIPDLDKFDTAWNMLNAVLSAPPEVLAAAMGGTVRTVSGERWYAGSDRIVQYKQTVIELPPHWVDGEGGQ